ncbi:phosphotransferase family protein [Paraburkholderia sp. CNPSo 3281]|uniref:phosphotransferase family protein n=1 Tax=Paraburkholderia sp. CNPSo 3281 TaxID=2940933 RepID=UPI0020B7C832|nr:phosphotransferase family protein [Paraburkholderia sp. CNPSo 3281]MCP3721077.1 phosphotransferase family protein [Paraburkholderia sp. CNPSo 3281]
MADANKFGGTGPVREAHKFDVEALHQWMVLHVAGFEGPLKVEQFKGGQSNPTYRVVTPSREYVLRRKPPGTLLKGAHAVEREARVMAALGKIGFPVPRIYGSCDEPSVIGSPFFVMELVKGRIFWGSTFEGVSNEDRHLYTMEMNRVLAQLHSVDYQALGLGDYGRAGRYVARQLERWSSQYMMDEPDAGRLDEMDRVIAWLKANLPERDETSLTHGDFRVDNLIFHPEEPRVLAVLDWELSTLGDPVADFAYNAMMYRLPSDILGGVAEFDLKGLGLPTEQEYVEAYCRATNRTHVPDFDYYVVFNMFRFAAILHGIKARVARGTAVSEDATAVGNRFAKVAGFAWNEAQRSNKRKAV